jgi:3',5'-cyclic AMP phosphodiesterase CpdA
MPSAFCHCPGGSRMSLIRILLVWVICCAPLAGCNDRSLAAADPDVIVDGDHPPLPSRPLSLKFAVIGDSGRWSKEQQETAQQLAMQRARFPFEFVLMLGDNNYGDGSPDSYKKRFEEPFKSLLDSKVRFYAVRGNHDLGPQWNYPLFNMNGHRYYTFEETTGLLPPVTGQRVRFFGVDTVNLDREQVAWLDRELSTSDADWKIVYLHHPVYSTGRYALSSAGIRRTLEQILTGHRADVVFSGHEHFYERMHPHRGVMYFVAGASGSVRVGDLRTSPLLARGYDRDLSFMLLEIAGDTMYFQAINRLGQTIDAGRIKKSRD